MADVATMSPTEKIIEAMNRSVHYMPADIAQAFRALLSPESLAFMAVTIVAMVVAQAFGVGEILDIILLGAGLYFLGSSVLDVADDLQKFGTGAYNATTDAELDAAAKHFASAVIVGGIDVVIALLLKKSAKDVLARPKAPFSPGLIDTGPPPAGRGVFYRPKITRPAAALRPRILGETSPYGDITVGRAQSITEQRVTLFHEAVHSRLSPRLRLFMRFRASLGTSAYLRVAFMRYLEEALAEFYGQLKVNGLAASFKAVRFPISGGYVTVTELTSEGVAIGNVILGGRTFKVYVVDRLHHSPGQVRRR